MRRRRYLAAVGVTASAGLAGCLATPDDLAGESDHGRTERTFPTLAVEADPAPGPATVDVRVVRGFDADGPARLRIAVTNGGSGDLEAIFGVTPPFTDLYSRRVDGGERAVLVPVDRPGLREAIPEGAENGTWRATRDVHWNATAVWKTLTPGETLSRTYALLAAHDDGSEDEALPAGEYRFEADDYLGRGSWGFTVAVSY